MLAVQDTLSDIPPPALPPELIDLCGQADAIAISTSGGKDSQALTELVVELYHQHGWTGDLFAIHSDLGQIEWPGTLKHIRQQCDRLGLPLKVVRHPKGMIGVWRDRFETLLEQGNTKPFWSSSQARYCTRATKIDLIDKHLRRYNFPICFNGIRAEESASRAKQPHFSVRNAITTKALQCPYKLAGQQEAWVFDAFAKWPEAKAKAGRRSCRFALTVNAVFEWSERQIWEKCGTSLEDLTRRRYLFSQGLYREAFEGFPGHWAYVAGNSRLSCSMCVLASQADVLNGALLNPRTWEILAKMEQESGWAFQQNYPLTRHGKAVRDYEDVRQEVYATLKTLNLV